MVARLKTRSEMGLGPVINREWAMPSPDTLSVAPIRSLANRYLRESQLSVDVFSRNCHLCKITNDLNPQTTAEYHLTAVEFLRVLKSDSVAPDFIVFDPPYSSRQMLECYQSVGKQFTQRDGQVAGNWNEERNLIAEILTENGVVVSLGWNSNGIGLGRGFDLVEILIVAHGGAHNDTIVTVERKVASKQQSLFNAL